MPQNDHCKKQRQSNTVEKHISAKDENEAENASMKVRGIDCAPLLSGHVQIGKITNVQRELAIEELFLRGIVVNSKEQIAKMKAMILSFVLEKRNVQQLVIRFALGADCF